jgi:ATP-binding protein involved in chromosome partitioning
MTDVTKEQVLAALAKVRGPDLTDDIVSLKMVSDVFISDNKVYFSITVPADRAEQLEPLRAAAERSVKAVPGVKGALVTLTADRKAGAAPSVPPSRPQSAAPPHAHGSPARPEKAGVPGVGRDHSGCVREGGEWGSPRPLSILPSACRPLG